MEIGLQAIVSLDRVTGIIADLRTSTASEDFVFRSDDRAAGGVAAVGLAAAGLAGAATGAAISSGDAADRVTVFVCNVGSQRVTGRFGEVTFAEGDEVEVVGHTYHGNMSALAIVRASDRTIWMHPHCSRGTRAYWRHCLRWIPTLAIATSAAMITCATYFSSDDSPPLWFQAASIAAGAVLLALILALVARRFHTFAKLSDQIFRELGFESPESVDLPKRHSLASRELSPEDRKQFHPWKRWVYKY